MSRRHTPSRRSIPVKLDYTRTTHTPYTYHLHTIHPLIHLQGAHACVQLSDHFGSLLQLSHEMALTRARQVIADRVTSGEKGQRKIRPLSISSI